jgi:hypothetical protein
VAAALALDGTAEVADAVLFLATLLLFWPRPSFSRLVLPEPMAFLVRGLGGNAPRVTVRVLNAFGRVLFSG